MDGLLLLFFFVIWLVPSQPMQKKGKLYTHSLRFSSNFVSG